MQPIFWVIEAGESYQLRGPSIPHGAHFGAKKGDIAYISRDQKIFL